MKQEQDFFGFQREKDRHREAVASSSQAGRRHRQLKLQKLQRVQVVYMHSLRRWAKANAWRAAEGKQRASKCTQKCRNKLRKLLTASRTRMKDSASTMRGAPGLTGGGMPAMTGGITMVVAGIGILALSSAFFAGRGIVLCVVARVAKMREKIQARPLGKGVAVGEPGVAV